MDTYTLRESKFLTIINLLISTWLIYFLIGFHITDFISFTAFIIPSILVLWNLTSFLKSFTKFDYNNQGITIRKTFRRPVSFHWENIDLMDGKLMVGDIGISEKTKKKQLDLVGSLKGINRFYDFLNIQRPDLFKVSIGSSIRPNLIRFQLALTIISIFSLILIFLLYQRNSIWLALVLGFVILVAVKHFLWDTRELTFEKDKIVLKSWVKTFEYELQNIKTIDFDPFLILEQKDGNLAEISLPGYSGFILYLQLRNWLDSQKTQQPNPIG